MNAATYSVPGRVLLTEMQDGTGVLLHLETRFYYTLNGTGVFAWKAIESGEAQTVAALTDALVDRFEVDVDTARADLEALAADLTAEGLLDTTS